MRTFFFIIVSLFAFVLVACTSPETKIGYRLDSDIIDSMLLNRTTKVDVVDLVGFSPNIKASFDEPVWYYVYEYRDKYEDLIDRQILILSFDSTGVLNGKRLIGNNIGRDLTPDSSKTKVYSTSPSLLNTLFGGVF